jgi:hypothetical protein
MTLRFNLRTHAICAALLLMFAVPAAAQTSPMSCSRAPNPNRPAPTAQMIAAREAAKQACAADMATYCQGVSAACGGRQKCLEAHSAQLSPACASARQNLRAARRART